MQRSSALGLCGAVFGDWSQIGPLVSKVFSSLAIRGLVLVIAHTRIIITKCAQHRPRRSIAQNCVVFSAVIRAEQFASGRKRGRHPLLMFNRCAGLV